MNQSKEAIILISSCMIIAISSILGIFTLGKLDKIIFAGMQLVLIASWVASLILVSLEKEEWMVQKI